MRIRTENGFRKIIKKIVFFCKNFWYRNSNMRAIPCPSSILDLGFVSPYSLVFKALR